MRVVAWPPMGTFEYVENITLGGSVSLENSDIIFIDQRALWFQLGFPSDPMVKSKYNVSIKILSKRKAEIEVALAHGATVVWFADTPKSARYMENSSKFVSIGNVFDNFIFNAGSFLLEEGENIEKIPNINSYLSEFLDNFLNHFRYFAIHPDGLGYPILRTKKTKKCVGSLLPLGKGNILILPKLLFGTDAATNTQKKVTQHFIQQLMISLNDENDLFTMPNTSVQPHSLPDWLLPILTPREISLIEKQQNLLISIKDANTQLDKNKVDISKMQREKSILSSDGDLLEEIVLEALQSISINAQKGPSSEVDIIIDEKSLFAVVEIKGTKKSAALSHSTQLTKWIADNTRSDGTEPKGILIINAFKDKPISKRENPFPDNVIKYSKKHEQVYLTGLDLFIAVQLIINKNMKLKEFKTLLLETNGHLDFQSRLPEILHSEQKQA